MVIHSLIKVLLHVNFVSLFGGGYKNYIYFFFTHIKRVLAKGQQKYIKKKSCLLPDTTIVIPVVHKRRHKGRNKMYGKKQGADG